MHRAIELAATGIEVFAVAVIVIGFFFATVRFLFRGSQKKDPAFEIYKFTLGRSMLLGLTFLVAADVISTVALAPTLPNVAVLGILVILRTFLSWSLMVELEGRWPWSSASAGKQSEFMKRSDARERGDAYMDEPGSPARWGIETLAPVGTSAREDFSRLDDRRLVSSFTSNSFAGEAPTFRRSK